MGQILVGVIHTPEALRRLRAKSWEAEHLLLSARSI